MAVFHGVGVNFALSSSLSNVTGAFQTLGHGQRSPTELIMNGNGDPITKNYYGYFEEATFEYVATGASGGSITVTTGSVGSQMTVIDTQYTAIAGTTWLVDDVDIKGSNTTSKRVTCKLTRYPNITT